MQYLKVVALFVVLVSCTVGWTNKPGRPLIVLLVPDPTANTYVLANYNKIATSLVGFARSIMGKDNVIVMAGKTSMQFLRKYLPYDILLETDVHDFWLRDFSPVRQTLFKFVRENHYGTNIQRKLKNFIAKCSRQRFLYESALVIDGGNIMHNDLDKAALTTRIFKKNSIFTKDEIIGQLRHELNMNKIAVIPEVSGEPSGHIDLMMSFIDKDVIAYTDLSGAGKLKKILQKEFGRSVKLVELKGHVVRESLELYHTACGLHVNTLATDKFLYVPVFGLDVENRLRGQTTDRDLAALTAIANNSNKTVVPVPIAHRVCVLGGNTRCLSWHVKGQIADDLVVAAQRGGCGR